MTLRTAGDGVEEKLQHYLHLSGLFGSQELKPSLCFFKSCGAVISEHIQISNRNSSISQTHTHTHLPSHFLPALQRPVCSSTRKLKNRSNSAAKRKTTEQERWHLQLR